MSLARGPVLIAGVILFTYGLLGFLTNSDLPRDQFSDGTVTGESWLGIEVNGWTNFFATAAGGLLLFGAAAHLLARMTALIVGGALAACCVIALIDGEDVLGLAATNWATKVGFGVAAAWLLISALLPRRERDVDVATDEPIVTEEPIVTYAPADERREHVVEEPILREEPETPAVEEQGVRGERPAAVEPVMSEPVRSESADAAWAASDTRAASTRQPPARRRRPLRSRLRDLTRR